jgi:hypothetical protein
MEKFLFNSKTVATVLGRMKPLTIKDGKDGRYVHAMVRQAPSLFESPIGMQYVYNTNFRSELAETYPETVDLLRHAVELEQSGADEEEVHNAFQAYVNKATVSFSLPVNSSRNLSAGAQFSANVEFREGVNANGDPYRILTFDTKTIKVREAENVEAKAFDINAVLSGRRSAPTAEVESKSEPVTLYSYKGKSVSENDLLALGVKPAAIAKLPVVEPA